MTLGGLFVLAVCAKPPFCHRPAKIIHSPKQWPWLPLTSNVWCKEEQDCADWGNSGMITTDLLCNGTPRKVLCRGCLWEIKSCAVSCHSVCVPAWGKGFWGWRSCHDGDFVEGYYEQVQIWWGICSPSRSEWCNISSFDRWCDFGPSQSSLFSSLHKAGLNSLKSWFKS